MADSTVANLTAASALDGTELYYTVQGGADRKATGAQIKTLVSASPTLVTPNLGTPSAGTLTSCTGLPVSTGLTGAGTGVLTALGVNTGSAGAFVVNGGALGTPSSGTLTNATGLPISTGVSGLGTGVATALAIAVGSAGAPVVLNGAGGTPSSLTLTNATGLPVGGISATGTPSSTTYLRGDGTWSASAGGGLTIGTTTIASGTTGRILYDNGGTTLGEALLTYSAANLQLGAADAAAPVAQTLQVQSVVAGTTNTAGATWTINGSKGTGTGSGGDIVFQTANAGSSGTSQNSSLYQVTMKGTSNIGWLRVGYSGTDYIGIGTTNPAYPDLQVFANGAIGWSVNASPGSGTYDLWLRRGAANTLTLGPPDAASPTAQTFAVQNVSTGTSNTAGANFTIAGSKGTGTGAGGSLIFRVAPAGTTGTSQNALATALTIDSTKTATFTGAVKTLSTTVSALPSASTAGAGARAFVTDATATTFLSTVAGSGSNKVPVVSDGTNWLIG